MIIFGANVINLERYTPIPSSPKEYFLAEVDSTNEFAKKLLNQSLVEHGVAILANWQFQGKGQESNQWESENGKNVLCSIVLLPDNLSIDKHVYLNMAVSLAVIDLLKELQIDAEIKWPNDIYVNHLKIAGILIENTIQGTQIKSVIIGLGLNVNQQYFHSTAKATSIFNQTGKNYNITELFKKWKQLVYLRFEALMQRDLQALWDEYHQHFYLKDILSTFEIDNKLKTGIVQGIHQDGRLILQLDGENQLFFIKQVKWI